MLHVEVTEGRGSSYQVGVEQAHRFAATMRGRRYLRSQREWAPASFSFAEAERAFQTYAPNLWDELRGLASGLDRPLEQIARDFGNFTLRYPRTGCSSLVNGSLYGRNYDFKAKDYEPRFALAGAKEVYASAGFSHFLIGRVDGMNEKGVVCGLHLISFRKPAPGFLATLIVRMVLDQCATTQEAIDLLHRLPHGFSYNYSLLDAKNDAAVVEASPSNIGVRRDHRYACTNHFQSALMRPLNPRNISHSRGRLAPLESWAAADQSNGELFASDAGSHLYALLNDSHGPAFQHGYSRGAGTLHTMVADPVRKAMLIGIGGDTKPTKIDLEAWSAGRSVGFTRLSGQLGGTKAPFPARRPAKRSATSHKVLTIKDARHPAAVVQNVDLSNSSFDDVNLSHARFTKANLSGVDIGQDCILSNMTICGISVEDLLDAYGQQQALRDVENAGESPGIDAG